MAITDSKTVLILGAGVSAPFGLPTGEQLMTNIAEHVNQTVIRTGGADRLTGHTFHSFGNDDVLLQVANESNASALSDLRLLRNLLTNQTSDSIDDFIVMNAELACITKRCIAYEMFLSMYDVFEMNNPKPISNLSSTAKTYELKNLAQRTLEYAVNHPGFTESVTERNWIHRLINLVRLGMREDGPVTSENKIQIITFNYDTILEHVLDKQFSNTLAGRQNFHNYRDFVDIKHVHGQIGELPENVTTQDEVIGLIRSWADGIRVVREPGNPTDDITQTRQDACKWIADANEIYACGFAFAQANTDLLGFGPGAPPPLEQEEAYPPQTGLQQVHYYNHGNNVGVRMAAERLSSKGAAPRTRTVTDSFTEGQNLSDWIGAGNLGELT